MKKRILCFLALTLLCGALLPAPVYAEVTELTIDENTVYQTLESFGASGCWWSQYMGLWDQPWGNT